MDNIKLNLEKLCAGHWSPRRLLSYNRILNMVIGPRGSGKSTGIPLYLVKDFLETRACDPMIGEYPHVFTFMRNTKDGYAETCGGFFENVEKIIKDRAGIDISIRYDGGADGGEYVIDDQLAGYGFPLTYYDDHKSTTKRVYNMYIDEFVAEGKSNGQNGYNGGKSRPLFDPEAVMSLMTSYDRGISESYKDMFRNEVRIFMSGNNYSYNCPYYVYFGIDKYLRTDSQFIAPKEALWVLEQTRPTEEYKEAAAESNVMRLMNEKDAAFSFDNKPRIGTDNGAFLAKPKGVRNTLCNLHADGCDYGVYMFPDSGIVWISDKYDKYCGMHIALTTEDHRPNYLMALRFSDTYAMKLLKDAYLKGYIRFANAKCKYMIDNYFMYT